MKRLLLSVLLVLVCSGVAMARNRLVPQQYPTIQAAIDASAYGDVVVVGTGIYDDCIHQASPTDTTKCVVVMKSGVALRGNGTGATIIEVRGRGRGIHCDGVVDATIEGLTVRGAWAVAYGAGIYCFNGSSPTIRDCLVRENADGGIIVRTNSHPNISNVTMIRNLGKSGGGLAIDDGSNPVINACIVDSNAAPIGGGVFIRSSAPQILNCLIRRNWNDVAAGQGGGLRIETANPVITGCQVWDNLSTGGGGGISLEGSVATIGQCSILRNRTTGTTGPGGGIEVGFNSDVTIQDCLIARNSIVGTLFTDGGGLRVWGGALGLTIRRSTIAANSAAGGLGGGVSTNGVFPVIEQSIIANNGPGAGLYCDDGPSGSFTVSCTDIYGNAGGNTICGTDAGSNFYLDPRFCDLASSNFHLQGTSPCLPGAHPAGPTACGGALIGALGPGCAPEGVTDPVAGLAFDTRPNPFSGSTQIHFDLPRAGRVGVAVYDAAGRELRSLAEGVMAAGPHVLAWDGADASGHRVPSGVYFYRLSIDGRTEGRRVIVAR
jgi:hypothetical protein